MWYLKLEHKTVYQLNFASRCSRNSTVLKFTRIKIGGNIELELVKLVCSIVENLVDKGNPLNIDKSQLVCDIFKNIFNLNPQEYDIVKKQIEYIYNNNQIIKIPFLRKLTRMVFNFITKKNIIRLKHLIHLNNIFFKINVIIKVVPLVIMISVIVL